MQGYQSPGKAIKRLRDTVRQKLEPDHSPDGERSDGVGLSSWNFLPVSVRDPTQQDAQGREGNAPVCEALASSQSSQLAPFPSPSLLAEITPVYDPSISDLVFYGIQCNTAGIRSCPSLAQCNGSMG